MTSLARNLGFGLLLVSLATAGGLVDASLAQTEGALPTPQEAQPSDQGLPAAQSAAPQDQIPAPQVERPAADTPPPGPAATGDDRLAANIEYGLIELRYFDGTADGAFNDAARAALTEFLADEGHRELAAEPTDDVRALIDAAVTRAESHRRCQAPSDPQTTGFVGCGVLTGG